MGGSGMCKRNTVTRKGVKMEASQPTYLRLRNLEKQASDTETLVYSMMDLDGKQLKELSERLSKLESLVEELMAAMERARIPRYSV